ncbi:MAG: alpha/beta hydrolase [Verrucomicrobiota bacterium]
MRGFFIFLVMSVSFDGFAQTRSSENDERLADVLKRFPQADANRDGVLTAEETRAFAAKRKEERAAQQEKEKAPPPSHADVSYGDHELQAFDLWLAKPSEEGKPTPLCIYIHGGGFRGGDKSGISGAVIERFLNVGISFASMNYRLTDGGKYPYPAAMHDAARGLQTLRAKAEEWNIDPEKIACYGGSAGAGISLWLGFIDDRAEPKSEDPVARQSTRIIAAGTMGGQSTYDMRVYRKWFGVLDLPFHNALPDFYGMQEGETADSPRVVALAEEASAINHLTDDDPPVYMEYNRPNNPVTIETSQGEWVHHPLLGLKLQEAMAELGLECIVVGPGIEDETYEDVHDFMIRKLTQ